MGRRWRLWLFVLSTVVMAACTPAAGQSSGGPGHGRRPVPASTTTTTTAPVPLPTTTSSTTTTEPPPPPAPVRPVARPGGSPFATTSGLTLVHPADDVERVAFHESNNDGARPLEFAPSATNPTVLESRERDTPAQTAADIVVAPDGAIRAPVSGTVKRGGGYTLYCKYHDEFVVIRPDGAPGLEVKVLHLSNLQVRRGQRVVAGETVIAAHPDQLPFASQVDELATVQPAWPHVHVEVVDPTVHDRPTPGGGCPTR